MMAYEFSWPDEGGKQHLIGVLPERRGKPERITNDSILNWRWNIIGDNSDVSNIYFIEVEMWGCKE
jgi:hypothetical protein